MQLQQMRRNGIPYLYGYPDSTDRFFRSTAARAGYPRRGNSAIDSEAGCRTLDHFTYHSLAHCAKNFKGPAADTENSLLNAVMISHNPAVHNVGTAGDGGHRTCYSAACTAFGCREKRAPCSQKFNKLVREP